VLVGGCACACVCVCVRAYVCDACAYMRARVRLQIFASLLF